MDEKPMKRFDWKQTIKINIVALKMLGLWPPGDETYKRSTYTLYEAFVLLFFEISHIGAQTLTVFIYFDDLEIVTGIIYVLLTEMLGLLKAYCLIKNMGKLKQLMITINSDSFQPKSLHQRNLIQPNLDAWKRIALTFSFLCWCWLLIWNLCPIFDNTFREYRLPFSAWYPFSTQTSPQYEFTYLHQFVAIIYVCMTNQNIDTLTAALNMYIGAQFDLLCDDVRHFHEAGKDDTADAIRKLKSCVNHHREILTFAEYVNNFYNWILFLQFFVGGFSIGLAMFQLSVAYKFTCTVGSSSHLPYAVFESDWTDLSPEVKKMLIFFYLKVQKPLKMSSFGLFYLSLDTFVKVNLNHFM
ncbi:7tm 6 domain containing protein [Asbolus verrucosus]|uniref:Odorant receptor n=1 Tax=Asbolus verrucosus TaxID=1661398 RepID=A0A482VZL0_ASBVE|nr:7tm 6 domain containing protein [Asbolus verrucosus]